MSRICKPDLVMFRRVVVLVVVTVVAFASAWALMRYRASRDNPSQPSANEAEALDGDAWTRAIEKVKEDRGAEARQGGIEIPPELRHYSDRHWFLATQVAEVAKQKLPTSQDFIDLAGMIQRGEMVSVPAVTDSYVLFGVGAQADGDLFNRYENDENIDLYPEAQVNDAYKRLDEQRSTIQADVRELNKQLGTLSKRDRTKRSELQKQISVRQQDLQAVEKDKSELDEFYSNPQTRQAMFRDYDFIRSFAGNFGGRSYNLDDPSDRQALKVSMLRSLRPPALKIMEEVASAYHRQFDRPLPVSSLVRPEQYQRALRRVNRNAVLIDVPPHSTGLAFDIDYRYMSAAEQSFVMGELARLEKDGRIEVIRESNANYHVFAFMNGGRPSDDLIRASLDEAGSPVQAAHHSTAKASKPKAKSRSQKAKSRSTTSRTRKRRR